MQCKKGERALASKKLSPNFVLNDDNKLKLIVNIVREFQKIGKGKKGEPLFYRF